MVGQSIKIGTVTLLETTEFTQRYAVAAWYQTVRVKAGHTAPIFMRGYVVNHNPQHPEGYALGEVCGFEGSDCYWAGGLGTIIDGYFPTLFGGVKQSSGKQPELIGTTADAPTIMPFHWSVGEAVLLHGGRLGPWQITLDESVVEVTTQEYDSERWDYAKRKFVACRAVMYPLRPRKATPDPEEPAEPELAEPDGISSCDVCGDPFDNDRLVWGNDVNLGEYLKVCGSCYQRITTPHGPVPAESVESEGERELSEHTPLNPLNELAHCWRCNSLQPYAVWGALLGQGGTRICTNCGANIDESDRPELASAHAPSFEALNGRTPEPGRDYDPDAPLCEDDHDYLAGAGQYSAGPAEREGWKRAADPPEVYACSHAGCTARSDQQAGQFDLYGDWYCLGHFLSLQ